MKDKKDRHTVWMEPVAWDMVGHHYREDNCSTKNEYIEKAIRFYSGYLDATGADEYLPRVLSDVLEGKLSALGTVARVSFRSWGLRWPSILVRSPWGSTSSRRTFFPSSARPAPRL